MEQGIDPGLGGRSAPSRLEAGKVEENRPVRRALPGGARHAHQRVLGGIALLAVAVACVLAAAQPALAKTLSVCTSGCQYTTIADAIAAASPGKKITVGPGTYSGGIVIDKSVKLIGAGVDQTVIDGGGMVITVGTGASVAISGVAITGGKPDYSLPDPAPSRGILNNGVLTLKDSAVTDNQTLDDD